MPKFNVLIGADPELFIRDTKTSKFVSAHDFIPGNKSTPMPVPLGAIQVDGVAAEFNITPAKTKVEFIKNINHVRNIIKLLATRQNPFYEVVAQPTALFEESYFRALPPEVLLLGCEPDYSAYTGKENEKPETELPMRTGSGHVHVGFLQELQGNDDLHSQKFMERCSSLVQNLDFAFQFTSKEWDKDDQRRTLYGKPGAFRPKPYGLEYRVLSNAWLNNAWSTEFVYDTTKAITQRWLKGFDLISTAKKEKVTGENLFELSEFMYLYNLPEIDTYSPTLETRNLQKYSNRSLYKGL